jgi:hypothetical protein
MAELPTLTKRQLQAQVIGPIYTEMVAELGEARASAILDSAIKKAAIAEGHSFAAKAPGGVTSMADFIKLYENWTADGALEIEVLEPSISMSPAANTPRLTGKWAWARLATCYPATVTAHSAKAMIQR